MRPSSSFPHKSSKTRSKSNESSGLVFETSQDYISDPNSSFSKEFSVVYIVGEDHYNLLKVFLKQPILGLVIGDRLDLISKKSFFYRIKRINIKEIPKGSEYALEEQLTSLVTSQEKPKFINFFNEAKPITLKLHQLKLLPGV
ncbi:MAG: DUF655 domain-containing protein, partial [Candidatus Hodarchaeales archaeon]